MASNPLPSIDLREVIANTIITRIVFDKHGAQMRTTITGGKTHDTFIYPSKRFRRGQTGDGRTELLVHMISEVQPDRLDFLPQPCRIEATVYGRPACAFPDYAAVDIGQRPVLGEAKLSWEHFERPTAIAQQAISRKGADALGWQYQQVTATGLGNADFLASVEEIQAHRFVNVPMSVERASVLALREHGELELGELVDFIRETPGRGLAFASALMVRRIIAIDLDRPLTERSIVRLAPKRPFVFPRIRL